MECLRERYILPNEKLIQSADKHVCGSMLASYSIPGVLSLVENGLSLLLKPLALTLLLVASIVYLAVMGIFEFFGRLTRDSGCPVPVADSYAAFNRTANLWDKINETVPELGELRFNFHDFIRAIPLTLPVVGYFAAEWFDNHVWSREMISKS